MITNPFYRFWQRPTGGVHGQCFEEGVDTVNITERLQIARLLHAKDARQVILLVTAGPLVGVHLHAGVEDTKTVLNVHVDHLQYIHKMMMTTQGITFPVATMMPSSGHTHTHTDCW